MPKSIPPLTKASRQPDERSPASSLSQPVTRNAKPATATDPYQKMRISTQKVSKNTVSDPLTILFKDLGF